MSGVELKPINEAGGANILLPLGKTNLGRGSFFEIADKRVSRNHAVLEVEDGKIRVMPIHTNPTFFDGAGGTKLAPLTKDVWQNLKHGDRIALTPDEHIFEVVIDYRPIVQETQSPRLSSDGLSPLKQTPPFKQSTTPSHQNNGIRNEKKENGENDQSKEDDDDGMKGKSTEKAEETSPATSIEGDNSKASTTDGKNVTEEEEDKSKMEETKEQDGQEEEESKHDDKSTKGAGTVVYDDKEIALPVQKERALPAWMTSPPKPKGEAKRTTTVTPAKKAPQNDDTATPQKRGRGRPKTGAKATPQAKKTPSQTKGRAKKYADDDDDDYLSEEEPAPKKSKTSRSQRGTSKVASYAEDDYDVLDEEWIASDLDDDDDASDWEMESQSQSSKKGRGKGKSPKGKFVSPRKRGRRKKYAQSSDEDDWSEEEAYVPRPTKRRASSSSNSQPTSQRKRGRKARHDSDFSDEEEEYVPKPTKRTPAKTKKVSVESKKDHNVSGEEDDDDGDKAPPKKKPEKKKKLKSCQFGKRCYRKNPAHFAEYCHPGDPDYRSEGDEYEDDDDDDDRLDCEYGTACYRKSEEHKDNYKHTKPPPRPKREAAQKVLKTTGFSDDEDNDEPNTYDYNDSFLNDDVSDSASMPAKHSDDSDWNPEDDSQDVRNLQKEAKEFMRNKKMQKT